MALSTRNGNKLSCHDSTLTRKRQEQGLLCSRIMIVASIAVYTSILKLFPATLLPRCHHNCLDGITCLASLCIRFTEVDSIQIAPWWNTPQCSVNSHLRGIQFLRCCC